jgi:Zn-dependent metalloprotease
VCSAAANLEYFGESGALNEANSDIMGTMVEFYARGGHDAVIGDRGANWLMGEQLETKDHPRPIRYMYKPSKDGRSPDAWRYNLEDLNVHRGSGPMNRCFFFLSHGASADKDSDRHTTLLPRGMAGIGNDRAARIWYRAMTTYLTSMDGYAEARDAVIAAAQDLYGAGGREEAAVWNAFHGINVGAAWQGPGAGRALE